jgi:hypothetical protein
MTPPEVDLPVKRLRGLQKRFDDANPGLFRYIDEVRLQSRSKWPSWCYAPIELVRALLVGAAENSGIRNPKPLLTDLVGVAMLAAWRTTQGIYVFDPDAQQDIWNTPVSGDIPSDVLFHLPQWCCFVNAPMRVFDEEVLGFLVSLNSDSERLPPELWLLVGLQRRKRGRRAIVSNSGWQHHGGYSRWSCYAEAHDAGYQSATKGGCPRSFE